MEIKSCRRCPLHPLNNTPPYKERRIGLKNKPFYSDVIINGHATTDPNLIPVYDKIFDKLPEKYKKDYKFFSVHVLKADEPEHKKFDDFSAIAKLSFDGFLDDGDYKITPEDFLYNYRYEGRIYFVGGKPPNPPWDKDDFVYYVAGDFDKDGSMFFLLFNAVRVRISPLESKVKNRKN